MNNLDLNTTNKNLREEFETHKVEVLLDMNEKVLSSNNDIIQHNLVNFTSSELYYNLQFHQNILENYIFFQEKKILYNYFRWLYKVSYSRNISLEFLEIQYQYWIKIYHKYLTNKCFQEVENIYLEISSHHQSFSAFAKKDYPPLQKKIEKKLYTYLLSSNYKEVKQYCENHNDNIIELSQFFSSHVCNVMQYVGQMWESNQISVAKEHIATMTAEDVFEDILQVFKVNNPLNKTIIMTSAPNEHHTLILRILVKILRIMGFTVINIGANPPKNDLIKAIEEFKPDYICISCTLSVNLKEIYYLTSSLEEKQHKAFKTIIAGRAFESLDNPQKTMNNCIYTKSIDEFIDYITYSLDE